MASFALRDADVIVARGPFALDDELELLRSRKIQWLVARNSGGGGARAKIDAARELGLPVIMLQRPDLPERPRPKTLPRSCNGSVIARLSERKQYVMALRPGTR